MDQKYNFREKLVCKNSNDYMSPPQNLSKKKLINLSKPEANCPIIGDFALATSRTPEVGSKLLTFCFVVVNYVYNNYELFSVFLNI